MLTTEAQTWFVTALRRGITAPYRLSYQGRELTLTTDSLSLTVAIDVNDSLSAVIVRWVSAASDTISRDELDSIERRLCAKLILNNGFVHPNYVARTLGAELAAARG